MLCLDHELRAEIYELVTLPAEPAWLGELGDITILGVDKQTVELGRVDHYVVRWAWPSGVEAAANLGVEAWPSPEFRRVEVGPSDSELHLLNVVRNRGLRSRSILARTARPVLRKAVAAADQLEFEADGVEWLPYRPFLRWLVAELSAQSRRSRPKAA